MSASRTPPRFHSSEPCRVGALVHMPAAQSRHMVKVLRVEQGDAVRLFDGSGMEFLARVERADAAGALVRVEQAAQQVAPGGPRMTLAFAPPPGARADAILEKGAELGADVFRPVLCERLQAFQAKAAERRLERWRRKVAEASRQAQRLTVPDVHAPVDFEQFVGEAPRGLRLIGSTSGAPGLLSVLSDAGGAPGAVTMTVGPAGGFTPRELDLAVAGGFVPVSLGANVLRVETAAICLLAGVVMWFDRAAEHA